MENDIEERCSGKGFCSCVHVRIMNGVYILGYVLPLGPKKEAT